MSVTSIIDVELTQARVREVVHAKQYDDQTRYITINLQSGGVAYQVPSGTSGMIEVAKPDGTYAIYDQTESGESAITISGSTVTVLLTEQVLAAPGIARAQIDLYEDGGAKLTTMTFDIDIHPSTVPEGAVSTDYYNVLNERVAAAQAAQAAAEAAQAEAESSADAAAASAASAAQSVEGAVKYNVAQSLTAAQAAQARENIDVAGAIAAAAVRYDVAQSLTADQQAQAAENVGLKRVSVASKITLTAGTGISNVAVGVMQKFGPIVIIMAWCGTTAGLTAGDTIDVNVLWGDVALKPIARQYSVTYSGTTTLHWEIDPNDTKIYARVLGASFTGARTIPLEIMYIAEG